MSNEVLTYSVDGLAFSVKFDRWDSLQPDRAWWHWRISETDFNGGWYNSSSVLLAEGSSLSTVNLLASTRLALEALASYLSAWTEAVQSGNPESENYNLFPHSILDAVDIDTFDQIVTGMLTSLGSED